MLFRSSVYVPTAMTALARGAGYTGAAVAQMASYGTMVLSTGTILGCLAIAPLAERFGRRLTLAAYFVVMAISIAVGFGYVFYTGSLSLFMAMLFLLGLGWCCSWVAGTTVLADITTPQERGRLTASNDQIVALCGATAVITAGFVLDRFGFPAVGIGLTVLLAIGLIPILRLREPEIGVYAD